MNFQLEIDGTSISNSLTIVGGTSLSVNTIFSVSLQYADSLMVAGDYVVLVQTMRECGGQIDHCSLLVQTYIP